MPQERRHALAPPMSSVHKKADGRCNHTNPPIISDQHVAKPAELSVLWSADNEAQSQPLFRPNR